MTVYYDKDVGEENSIKAQKIAVLGYGIQGAAQAQCLKDAGFDVVVGLRENGASWAKAKSDGMKVMGFSEACAYANVICMLTPDMTQKAIYQEHVLKNLSKGKTLYFSHGLNITYGLIRPPDGVDVVMVAPKAPGAKVRQAFLDEKTKVPCLVAVHNDATGKAMKTALGLAKAMKLTRAGAFHCTFDQETYSDLFGEQTVLCGGVTELVKNGFETLTEKGYPPELAYFEVLHELKLITDLIQEGGLEFMWEKVSETARYGGRTRGKRVITAESKNAMRKLLEEIEDGTFAHEWISEYNSGMPKFQALKRLHANHPIEKIGEQVRNAMKK